MTGPLYDVWLARRINEAHGGAVIAAWQVGQLDEATLELYAQYQRPTAPKALSAAELQVKAFEDKLRADFARRNWSRH